MKNFFKWAFLIMLLLVAGVFSIKIIINSVNKNIAEKYVKSTYDFSYTISNDVVYDLHMDSYKVQFAVNDNIVKSFYVEVKNNQIIYDSYLEEILVNRLTIYFKDKMSEIWGQQSGIFFDVGYVIKYTGNTLDAKTASIDMILETEFLHRDLYIKLNNDVENINQKFLQTYNLFRENGIDKNYTITIIIPDSTYASGYRMESICSINEISTIDDVESQKWVRECKKLDKITEDLNATPNIDFSDNPELCEAFVKKYSQNKSVTVNEYIPYRVKIKWIGY